MSPTYQDVESVIAGVPGVAEASVTAVEGSSRGRLRIRLARGQDAEQVSRAVAAALHDRLGLDIDPAAIRPRVPEAPSPADPDDAPASEAPAPAVDPVDAEPTPPVGEGTDGSADAELTPPAGEDTGASAGTSATTDLPADEQAGTLPRTGLPGVDELFRPTARERRPVATTNGEGHAGAGRRWHRPVIRDLALGAHGLEIQAEVALDVAGSEVRGRATGPATRRSTFRAIARATLDAVETMCADEVRTELEQVELVDDGQDERVIVTVTFLTHEGADRLVGVSISRGDAEQAVMRATLDAVNRRVGLLLED